VARQAAGLRAPSGHRRPRTPSDVARWGRGGTSIRGYGVDTDKNEAEQYERERKESHERAERERMESRERADEERRESRERHEAERRDEPS
jgi:hypothetical protein